MNIFKTIEKELHVIIEGLKRQGALPENIISDKVDATPPKDASHGDVATNAAMVLAAQTGKNPREIAALLVERINQLDMVESVQIAGPGFINMTLKQAVWQQAVLDILRQGRAYGDSDAGKGTKVNVEYVSVNPTGPMHVGHGRGAVFGDALATLLKKAGYTVTKEYYINDAGAQVDKLADSAYLRYREANGEVITEIPEGLYPGDYLVPVGQALAKLHGKKLMDAPRDAWLPIVRDYSIDAMMDLIRGDLEALGVVHDVFTSERAITKAGKVDEALSVLESKKLIYTGVLEPPKGKTPDDWEPRPQTLFKSTEFGDDVDRAIKKSDGSWTYFAPDIAYHFDKCQRGFDLLIDIFGADHGGYVKRIKSAVNALTDGKVAVEVKLMQMIKLMRGGQPAKMSKRAGNFVILRDVIDEVGKGVFRFIMLTRKNDAPLDFDFDTVMQQSRDNPVFYVQYAHARARSVIRNAFVEFPDIKKNINEPAQNLHVLIKHPAELALIRLLCSWPRTVESAAAALEPHRIAFYLQDVAAAFHGLWNLGNDDISLRFIIKDDIQLTASRVMLADAVSNVIASGLLVLGVEPVEEMR
ncbi:MAG: arginine--tRNA ligase [Alphaproteobacteria bacterium]